MYRLTTILLVASAVVAASADECDDCICIDLTEVGRADRTKPVYSWSRGEAETNKIDVLVVYDDSAVKWLMSNSGLSPEPYAVTQVDCLNGGIANTGLGRFFQFRLAGVKTLPVDLSAVDLSSAIRNFIGKIRLDTEEGIAAIEDAKRMRDDVAADVVAVLVDCDDKSVSGIAHKFSRDYLSTEGLSNMASRAYCVCDISKLSSRFTLLHELGHIFGAGHDDEQRSDPGPQLQSYSAGYRFTVDGVDHTTVMGITSSGGKTFIRWPFFSSPLYTFGDSGVAVGTAKRHDNTRTIRETYPIVANFRVAKPLPPQEETGGTGISLSVVRESFSGEEDAITSSTVVQSVRYVSERFRVAASAGDSSKVTVKVKGLPSGLKFASKTGGISGSPKKAGRYTVTVTAKSKGMEDSELTFVISVSDLPKSLPGTYVGLAEVDGAPVLLTCTVSSSGKVTLKGDVSGKSCRFTATGLSDAEMAGGDALAFTAKASGKVGKATRTFTLHMADRTVESKDFSGLLYQNPWGRKDVSVPRFAGTVTTVCGDFQLKARNNGKVFVSGRPGGTKVSGTFQLVSPDFSDLRDGATFLLPVAFKAKKAFGGFAQVFTVRLSVGAGKKVNGIKVEELSDAGGE